MNCESARKGKYWISIAIRKIAIVFGVYFCFVFLLLIPSYFSLLYAKNEELANLPFITLFGGMLVFLAFHGVSCIERLRNCCITDYITLLLFLSFWGTIYIYLNVFPPELHLCVLVTVHAIVVSVLLLILFSIAKLLSCLTITLDGTSEPDQNHISKLSAEEIIKWTQNDTPNQKDFFNSTPKAEKIATRLFKSIEEKGNVTIGLRGQYGSGKTTIVEIVKNIVVQKNIKKDILFVQTNCWGYDNAQSAQEYVIREIISRMTKEGLDTDHLVGIPIQYIQALAKTHRIFGVIDAIFSEKSIPDKVLEKIDEALCFENKKLVLILEDLDRNKNNDLQLDSIEATLRRLRDTKRISFIITGFFPESEGNKKIDFEKTCDYTVETSMMPYHDKYMCLEKIAEYHEADALKIDEDNPVLGGSVHMYVSDETDYIYPHWKSLLSLIDTPRKLKVVVRDLDVAWNKLRGECDYMELLALTVLRNTDDAIFEWIVKNLSELRNRNEKIKKDVIYERYRSILDWLFFPNPVPSRKARRICKTEIVDYFARILNENFSAEESDQRQWRAIQEWNHSTDREQKMQLIDIVLGTDKNNLPFRNRWLFKINRDTVSELTTQVLAKIQEAKCPYHSIIILGHLLRMNPRSSPVQRILEGLENDEDRPIFYLLAYELIFKTAPHDNPNSWHFDALTNSKIVPNECLELFGEEQHKLMTELSHEAEPATCSSVSDTKFLKSHITVVSRAAKEWLEKYQL